MGQFLGHWQTLNGACVPCSLHGQIFNMAGFGMWERGFNTIISGMIVSHYSAVESSMGRRVGMFVERKGGCLLLQLWCASLSLVVSQFPPVLPCCCFWCPKCWMLADQCCLLEGSCRNWEIRRRAACVFMNVCSACVCVSSMHVCVCLCVCVCVCSFSSCLLKHHLMEGRLANVTSFWCLVVVDSKPRDALPERPKALSKHAGGFKQLGSTSILILTGY